jgi:hypothetical protein
MPAARLRVRCVTWNVGEIDGEFYETHTLLPLLLGRSPTTVDIVAIGLQEVQMTAKAFIAASLDFKETTIGRKWSQAEH